MLSWQVPVAEDLDPGSVVESGDGLHQVAGRVVAEVRRDVADPDPAVGGQVAAKLVGRLVEHADLLDAQLRVAVGDGLPEIVAQRVEHRVVRVNRRQPVLLQLVGHDVDEGLHAGRVVGPIADNLRQNSR